MHACKCALDHVPIAPVDPFSSPDALAGRVKEKIRKSDKQLYSGSGMEKVSQCEICKPVRRCPECPTEYLIQMRLVEDTSRAPSMGPAGFKQAIVVTRWSDLGGVWPGRNLEDREWAAVKSRIEPRYDSFATIGRRSTSATFESLCAEEQIPGQRVLSLNPGEMDRGEEGDDWY
jgi:hypothetical protein